jgi:hypothetical protein
MENPCQNFITGKLSFHRRGMSNKFYKLSKREAYFPNK